MRQQRKGESATCKCSARSAVIDGGYVPWTLEVVSAENQGSMGSSGRGTRGGLGEVARLKLFTDPPAIRMKSVVPVPKVAR